MVPCRARPIGNLSDDRVKDPVLKVETVAEFVKSFGFVARPNVMRKATPFARKPFRLDAVVDVAETTDVGCDLRLGLPAKHACCRRVQPVTRPDG